MSPERTKQVWNWVILGASLVAWGVIWLVDYGVTQWIRLFNDIDFLEGCILALCLGMAVAGWWLVP